MHTPLPVTAFSCATATGLGKDAMRRALVDHQGGLEPYAETAGGLNTFVGRVAASDAVTLPEPLRRFDCRNNRLAELALGLDGFDARVAAVVEKYGAVRIGVVLGTSTSGIGETERAYMSRDDVGDLPGDFYFRETHELSSLADYVRARLSLQGPAYVISTACASSAKTFVDGAQLIEAGLCDAVVIGGVDSLCDISLRGFQSLQLLSSTPCRPNDNSRDGISIGEAGCFALMERMSDANAGAPRFIGYGESADAYHMSSPHPEGKGAVLAMQSALRRAGLDPHQIDYINMHGTGSHANDAVEAAAISSVFGGKVPCSSTKGWTGHVLGAAGIAEALISLICLKHGLLPGNLNLQEADPTFTCALQHQTEARQLNTVLSNSFGFGGNNCSLIFARGDGL